MKPDCRWGRDPLSRFYGFQVTSEEKSSLDTWMEKHGASLPSMKDGEDPYIGLYMFLPNQDARQDMGDYTDDRDGAEFAQESISDAEFTSESERRLDAEKPEAYEAQTSSLDANKDKALAYPSLESSGDLASTWARIEKMLESFWESKRVSPSQFLRLERSKVEPKRRQYRRERAKNSNWSTTQKVWDDSKQELEDQNIEKFYTQRCETLMIFDPVTREYLELPKYTFTDDTALDVERRRMERGSKRPKNEIVVNDAEAKPYIVGVHGPALTRPLQTERQWSGDKADPTFRAWANQGPSYPRPSRYEGFEGLQRFKQATWDEATCAHARARKSGNLKTLFASVSAA